MITHPETKEKEQGVGSNEPTVAAATKFQVPPPSLLFIINI